jgi:hypothetical protein
LVLFSFLPDLVTGDSGSEFIEQKRALLYLYRSDFGETATDNDGIHIWLPVVSLLGLELDIIDTLSPDFPSEKTMEEYAGIIAPTGAWETSLPWCKWLTKQVKDHNRKVLVIAPLGPGDPEEENAENGEDGANSDYEAIDDGSLNQLYKEIGLVIDTNLSVEAGEGGESLIVIGEIDDSCYDFEDDLSTRQTPYFLKMSAVESSVKSFLTLKWKNVKDSEGLAVCATDNGGFAIEEYIRRQDYISEENFWYINPLKFLIQVFKLRNLPVPEPSRMGNSRLVALFIETDGKIGNSRFARFVKMAEDLQIALSPIRTIPDIDEDIDKTKGIFSIVADQKSLEMDDFAKSPVSSIEAMAEEVFGGKLASDYRVKIFIDLDVFESEEATKNGEIFLQAISDSDFFPFDSTLEAAMVAGAHSFKHGLVRGGGYYLSHNGPLREARSIAGDGYPDLSACENIFGYKKAAGRLIIHLGEKDRTILRLVNKEPEQVYLSGFNRYVSVFKFDSFRWVVRVEGPSGGKLEMSGLKRGERYVSEFFKDTDERLFEESAFSTDLSGNATIVLPGKGIRRVEFWSDKDNSYWFVKVRRFFWATGTLPFFIVSFVFIFFLIIWKITKLVV